VPIKLEVFGETIAEFAAELEALSAVIRPLVQTTTAPVTPPDEARTLIDEHFEEESYEAAIEQPKPAKLTRKRGRPPLGTVDEALKKLKQNGGEPEPALR
jgi:hypothetical protein